MDPNSENVSTIVEKNPLLERFNKMPPETFRMPSGGILYNNGEIDADVINGEVIIYPMTTVDEITMRSPDMLYQGTAIEKVFSRCIPEIKKPFDILANDVDYLLICLRIVTYGNNLQIYWNCPICTKNKDESAGTVHTEQTHEKDPYELAKSIGEEAVNVKPVHTINLSNFLRNIKPLDLQNKNFEVNLDTGECVKLRPSTFGEMIKLYQYDPSKLLTPEEMTEYVIDAILSVIDSVDGVKNREFIREWALRCKAPVLNKLQEEIHKANDWGTSHQHSVKCDKCGHETELEIPLNPLHFFTAPST